MDKKALRAEIRAKKKQLTEEQIVRASEALCRRMAEHPVYRAASALYAYLSFNQEIRTRTIMEQALRDGKRVAVPKVYGEEMRFIWLDDLDAVAPGYYDIPEPIADGPVADDEQALILMPGLAFDPKGNRCGYGGGFYDKYLEQHPHHKTLALCFDFQMVAELPVGPYDIPVDVVLSEPV